MAARSFQRQIIDGDGVFNVSGLERLVKSVQLKECGVSYTVVSIMGTQSSGKSTLLNHLFRTNFEEMDSDEGRSQTTKGIWMARAVGMEPCTLVLDLEGFDGTERGEDDTAFERQSALFALAISDIVLINMWCHDIGREQAASKPLLRTVFKAMARLFALRKTTLLFVIRDKTRSPFEKLESFLRKDIQNIWDSGAHSGKPLCDFFDVQVVALPNFETSEELFIEEVASLRQRFSLSMAHGGIAWNRQGIVPASDFSVHAQQIWKRIKENKDLDLPSLAVMVSTIRCEEIMQEKFNSFHRNKDLSMLEKAVRLGPCPDFRRESTCILDACLAGFANEAIHFHEDVSISKQRLLDEKLLQLVEPAFQSLLGHFRSENLCKFKEEFDKALLGGRGGFSDAARNCTQRYLVRFDDACAGAAVERANWDTSRVRENLRRDMDAYVASQQSDCLSSLTKVHEAKLYDALSGPVEELFQKADEETWPSVRNLLRRETERAVSEFSVALSDFEIDERVKEHMLTNLQDHAKGVVETKAREVAKQALRLMKERFFKLFLYDENSNLRKWRKDDDIQAIATYAFLTSTMVLPVLSWLQLDDKADAREIAESRILIKGSQWHTLWKQLEAETTDVLYYAIFTQEAEKGNLNPKEATHHRIKHICFFIAESILQSLLGVSLSLGIPS